MNKAEARESGYLQLRDNVERNLFPEYGDKEKPEGKERPVYGALNTRGSTSGGADSAGSTYGKTVIVLKEHVKKQCTYTLDDTFFIEKFAMKVEDRAALEEKIVDALADKLQDRDAALALIRAPGSAKFAIDNVYSERDRDGHATIRIDENDITEHFRGVFDGLSQEERDEILNDETLGDTPKARKECWLWTQNKLELTRIRNMTKDAPFAVTFYNSAKTVMAEGHALNAIEAKMNTTAYSSVTGEIAEEAARLKTPEGVQSLIQAIIRNADPSNRSTKLLFDLYGNNLENLPKWCLSDLVPYLDKVIEDANGDKNNVKSTGDLFDEAKLAIETKVDSLRGMLFSLDKAGVTDPDELRSLVRECAAQGVDSGNVGAYFTADKTGRTRHPCDGRCGGVECGGCASRSRRRNADLGFNCVRIFLQYKVYEADPAWFLKAFERYLALADEAKLKVMPVLFDDCTFWPATDPQLGKQTDPLPGWGMWGWVPSPGHTMVVDYRTHGALEKYLKDVIACHRDDPRIFMWDLYNEPTNCMQPDRKKYAIDLMRKCFRWAREIGPAQPLTVACWHPNDPKFDEIALAESDIVTFHCYGNAATTRKKIAAMSAPGRPVICTEWLYRPNGCDIPNVLCIYKETGVGCMLWGLVNGKAQTHIPNGRFTANYKGPWKHDLFHSDHRPYSVTDLELIRAATRTATK